MSTPLLQQTGGFKLLIIQLTIECSNDYATTAAMQWWIQNLDSIINIECSNEYATAVACICYKYFEMDRLIH
jgi:hypothetical protein